MRNSLHSCIYLSLSIYLSIYFKIVWPQVCFLLLSSQATCRSRRCHRSKEKGTVTSQKPNFCLWGTWKFSPKNSLHRENSQTNYLYINKSLQKICCSFFKALSIMKVFSWTIHDSTPPNRKTVITTEVLSSLSVEKIIHHFHLRASQSTETNDNHCKLKNSIRVKASRPLLSLRKQHEATTHRLRGSGNITATIW